MSADRDTATMWPTYSEVIRALHDFAQLLPPERWRLLHPETNETLRVIQFRENEEYEVQHGR